MLQPNVTKTFHTNVEYSVIPIFIASFFSKYIFDNIKSMSNKNSCPVTNYVNNQNTDMICSITIGFHVITGLLRSFAFFGTLSLVSSSHAIIFSSIFEFNKNKHEVAFSIHIVQV